jgi:ligand-binding sensor domain-containing protein/two-component sensor histidine kinase
MEKVLWICKTNQLLGLRDWFYAAVFCLFASVSVAQEPFMWRYTEEDGLPSMTIYDIFIGNDKFIYLATDAGCYRYDGVNFKHLPAVQSRSRGLTSGKYCKEMKLWYKNFSGQIFYLQNDSLKALQEWENPTGAKEINYFGFDSQNRLWIQTTAGMIWYSNPQKTEFKALELPFIKLEKKIIVSIAIKNDTLIASTTMGEIMLVNMISKEGKIIKLDAAQKGFYIGISNDFFYAREQHGEQDFYLWNGQEWKKNQFINQLIKNTRILNQTDFINSNLSNSDDFWLITNKGAFQFAKDKYIRILADEAVTDVGLDYEGNYWFSTALDGLYMMPSLSVKTYNSQNSHWKDSRITRLAQAEGGSFLVGGYDGSLFRVDKNLNLLNEYQKVAGGSMEIEFLHYDSVSRKIYTSQACYELNQSSPIFSDYYIKDGVFFQNYAFVAASTFSGFIQLKKTDFYDPRLKYFFQNSSEFSKNRVGRWTLKLNNTRSRCVLYDPEKRIYWVGDTDGLKKYDSYAQKTEIKDAKGSSIIAASLYRSPEGTIAVSTMQQGIYVLKDDQITHHFTIENGLKTNMGGKIKIYQNPDQTLEIWQCTDKGIQYIDLASRKIQFIDKRDGLGTDLVMDLMLIEDTIWAATNVGLLKLPKSLKEPNSIEPLIFLTSIKIKEKDTVLSDYYALKHNQNSILISFQALSYKSRGKFKYKYRMLGLDSNWIYTSSTDNFARFLSLPTGSFHFEAKAINEDGVESGQSISVKIDILIPFWQKWWFIALIFLAAMSLLLFGFWLVIRSIKIRNKLLLSKAQLETDLRSSRLASLRAQMNPHFIFNALNSIQEFILLNNKKMANFYLGKFANLMRLVLDMSNHDKVSLEDEIKSLELYLELEALRFEEGFSYRIESDPKLDLPEVQIPPLLVQPYVENAIKHGLLHKKGEKTLKIKFEEVFKEQKRMLACTIEDNGIGRKKSQELQALRTKNHTSFATGATAKRLELLHYGRQIQTTFQDLEPGTRVNILIPI